MHIAERMKSLLTPCPYIRLYTVNVLEHLWGFRLCAGHNRYLHNESASIWPNTCCWFDVIRFRLLYCAPVFISSRFVWENPSVPARSRDQKQYTYVTVDNSRKFNLTNWKHTSTHVSNDKGTRSVRGTFYHIYRAFATSCPASADIFLFFIALNYYCRSS